MLKTFNYNMDAGAATTVGFRVNRTQFGDGYAQLSSYGINNKIQNWTGTKTGEFATVIAPIMSFIDEHQGTVPFTWTDPHGKTSAYTCAGYSAPQRRGNFWQISLEFEQFTSI